MYSLRFVCEYLIDLYNNMGNPNYVSTYKKSLISNRSLNAFLRTIPLGRRMGKGKLNKLSNANFNTLQQPFNLANRNDFLPWIDTEEFLMQETSKILELAKKYKTNTSNIIETAYFRAIAHILRKFDTPINVGRQYDSRFESNVQSYNSICNLHISLPNVVSVKTGETFLQTLQKVTEIDKIVASNHLIAKKISLKPEKIFTKDSYFQFAPIAKLSHASFDITNNPITSIWFTSPSKNAPYITINTSLLEDKQIFISAAIFCTEGDNLNVKYILEWMKYEIRSFIISEDKDFYNNFDEQKAREEQFPELYKTSNNTTTPPPAQTVNKEQNTNVTSTVSKQKTKKTIKQTSKKTKKVVIKKSPVKTKVAKKTKSSNNSELLLAQEILSRVSSHKKTKTSNTINNTKVVPSNNGWTQEQQNLADEYFKYTGSVLIPTPDGKVKFQVKGKSIMQKRSWDDIKKFIDFKHSTGK